MSEEMSEYRVDIKWYEWLYQASNMWKIRWLDRKLSNWHIRKGKTLAFNTNKFWYNLVHLCKNNTLKKISVHRLVAQAFIPNLNNKPTINHKDWNRQNNIVDNLERATHWENTRHSYRELWRKPSYWMLGRVWWNKWKIWILNPKSKKVIQYSLDWNIIRQWDSVSDIHRELWFNAWHISAVCRWERYRCGWYIWKYIYLLKK